MFLRLIAEHQKKNKMKLDTSQWPILLSKDYSLTEESGDLH